MTFSPFLLCSCYISSSIYMLIVVTHALNGKRLQPLTGKWEEASGERVCIALQLTEAELV